MGERDLGRLIGQILREHVAQAPNPVEALRLTLDGTALARAITGEVLKISDEGRGELVEAIDGIVRALKAQDPVEIDMQPVADALMAVAEAVRSLPDSAEQIAGVREAIEANTAATKELTAATLRARKFTFDAAGKITGHEAA